MANLTFEEIQELKKEGFTEKEIYQAMSEIEKEELQKSYQEAKYNYNNFQESPKLSSFESKIDDNLGKWQLDVNEILERIEHILRGDIPSYSNNKFCWLKNPNPEKNVLNETGIQEVMKILAMYVNKNTLLSDYTNQEINLKVLDFGMRLNNLIFMREYEFGLDTNEKRKNYELLVGMLVDVVHSAYKRALYGSEKVSLRQMVSITQATNTSAQFNTPDLNGQGIKERGILNPMRYLKGKTI